jgi:hypothetical protein
MTTTMPVNPAGVNLGDGIFSNVERAIFEASLFAVIDDFLFDFDTAAAGLSLSFSGSDQNSYYDEDYRHAPMPPGFMSDFGGFLSSTTRQALGFNFYDYGSADIDPEFITEAEFTNVVNAALDITGRQYGSDFQLNRNGHSIQFTWHPSTDPIAGTNGLDNGTIFAAARGGHYTSQINYTPFGDNSNQFSPFTESLLAGSGYRTYTNFDWGDPVALSDRRGTFIDNDGEIIYRPQNITPQEIYNFGLAYRNASWSETSTMLQILFKQGGRYDFQRQGGDLHTGFDRITEDHMLFHREYKSFSTVAIGLFAAGAGISQETILFIQNNYASLNSSFKLGTAMHDVYRNLPSLNVANTILGYSIAREYGG